MEVSRIGSRFYENAAQSGKKVKGKQQDGFAYELQKSYDEKYRSEDTDETGMTAADGAQASGIAEFGSMGGLRAKEVVAEGVLSKAVSACEVKNLTDQKFVSDFSAGNELYNHRLKNIWQKGMC